MIRIKQYLLMLSLLTVVSLSIVEMAHAQRYRRDIVYDYGDDYDDYDYDDYDDDYVYDERGRRMARNALIGAGVGAALGSAGGGRAAGIGAGVGAGLGILGGL